MSRMERLLELITQVRARGRFTVQEMAAQALGTLDPLTHAVVPPLHVATTFIRDPDNEYRSGYAYGRPDNATVRQTEAVIAALEGANEALVFGSGMAAATSVKELRFVAISLFWPRLRNLHG